MSIEPSTRSKNTCPSSMNQSAVYRPCGSTVAMSSAIARSPRSAKWLVAQHVFEPTSSTDSPGANGTVVSSWCIERACTYQ